MAAAPVPERVGRYELLLPIGQGGMAKVYLARVTGVGGFERMVALKLVHDHLRAEPELSRQLIEEAKLAANLRHANVVQVLDAGEDDGGVFLVMDYVEGAALSELTRDPDEPLPVPIAIRILVDALAGLHAAHELRDEAGASLGLVHRDFSPQNILVGIDGIARLADFGIAKATSRVGATRTGLVKGKVGYMAPEQARGHGIDRRTDVWAAGVIAWELVAGQRMYAPGDEMATMFRIVTEEPPRLRDVKEDVSGAVDACVSKALQRERDERWPTAEALRHGLLAAFEGSIAETSEVARYVARTAKPTLDERTAAVARVLEARSATARRVSPHRPNVRRAILATAGVTLVLAIGAAGVVRSSRGRTAAPALPSAASAPAREEPPAPAVDTASPPAASAATSPVRAARPRPRRAPAHAAPSASKGSGLLPDPLEDP
jgi:serine/threonine-protein kinase